MDLILYEPVHSSDSQDRVPGSAATNLRDVQNQAAAWLRRVVLTVVPDLTAWAGRTKHGHG